MDVIDLGPNIQVETAQAMVTVYFHISSTHHISYQFSPSFASAEPPEWRHFQACSRNHHHQKSLALVTINVSGLDLPALVNADMFFSLNA